MNNFNMNESRNRRNLLNWTGFFPFHSVTNYTTDASKIKMDMKNTFGEGLYINNLHLIPDPLKKNLADSIITGEVKTKTNMVSETKTFASEPKIKEDNRADHRADFYPSLSNISNFFSGVLSFVSGAMFQKRANSPAQYYECFEQNFDEMAPSLQAWPNAKPEDQNKNGRAHKFIVSTNEPTHTDSVTMTSDCRPFAAHEDKLNQVHFSPHPPKVHVMRVWAFAAKQARVGHWERHALDRERFKRRIADVDMAVSWVLKPQHRARVMFQRFMPWWNAQKRQELAEKKQKEEMGKIAQVNGELNVKSELVEKKQEEEMGKTAKVNGELNVEFEVDEKKQKEEMEKTAEVNGELNVKSELAEKKQKEELKKTAEVNGELNVEPVIHVDSSSVCVNNLNNENIHLLVNENNNDRDSDNDRKRIKECSNNTSETDIASYEKNSKIPTRAQKDNRLMLIDNKMKVLKFGFQDKDVDVSTT